MNTFVKLINGEVIPISERLPSEKQENKEKQDEIRKIVFDHIKEKKEDYKDLFFYQQIELIKDEKEDKKDKENFEIIYAFVKTLDTFIFADVISWISYAENFKEELERYIQYLAEKRMIMALSSGFGFEIHFIRKNPNFTSVFLSKVNYSEMKDRT